MTLKMYQERKAPAFKTLAIAAGKGGVGKSTVTVNLGLALQKMGYRVAIMDTDLYGPSIRKMLPEEHLPVQKGETFLPAICRHGLKVMSMAYFRKENEAAAIRAPIANNIITSFIQNVDWGEIDYLLIDFPPGTGDIQLTLAQKANLSGAIMVTTPQEVSLIDVRRALHLFQQVNVPILGIVENMSYYLDCEKGKKEYLFGKGGGGRLAAEAGVALLGEIPIERLISASGDLGESLFDAPEEEASMIAENFIDLATQVIAALSLLSSNTQGRSAAPFLKEIQQKDNYTFTGIWHDGSKREYRLARLQELCPCAGCIEKRAKGEPLALSDEVKALGIKNVGRYGLRIDFTSGCSMGIYDFDMLYRLPTPTA